MTSHECDAVTLLCNISFHAYSLDISDLTAAKRKAGGVSETTLELIYSKLILSFNNLKADEFMVEMR